MEINPRIEEAWVLEKIKDGWDLERIVEYVISGQSIPKKKALYKRKAEEEKAEMEKCHPSKKLSTGEKNYYLDPARMAPNNAAEHDNSLNCIAAEFPLLRMDDLRTAHAFFGNLYAPTYKALSEEMQHDPRMKRTPEGIWLERRQGGKPKIDQMTRTSEMWNQWEQYEFSYRRMPVSVRFMKTKRNKKLSSVQLSEDLRAERKWIHNHLFGEKEKPSCPSEASGGATEDSNEEATEKIECEVCLDEVCVKSCVGCEDGHFFCEACMQQAASEAAFGLGKSSVDCLAVGCGSGFALADLKRVVDEKVLLKLDERLAETNLLQAGLTNIERCKFCGWAAEYDIPKDVNKVFKCVKCEAEICRLCGLEWDELHMGVPCEEMESDVRSKARVEYETKMAEAVIRECHRCKNRIIKDGGCNKMTCQCGAKMCYICRAVIKGYDHFCQHPLSPPIKKCSKCTKCNLWDNVLEKDQQELDNLKKQQEKDERMFVKNKINLSGTSPPGASSDQPCSSTGRSSRSFPKKDLNYWFSKNSAKPSRSSSSSEERELRRPAGQDAQLPILTDSDLASLRDEMDQYVNPVPVGFNPPQNAPYYPPHPWL